jgi:hypothetical protein
MTKLDLLSRSQVVAILGQIQQIASARFWPIYVELLHDTLAEGSTANISLLVLDNFLAKHPALQYLHQMLNEELREELPRSLPLELGEVYLWYVVSVDVANAYVTLALRRDKTMHEAKDIVAARKEVSAILAAEWASRSSDVLAAYFGQFRIDSHQDVDEVAVTHDFAAIIESLEAEMECMRLA